MKCTFPSNINFSFKKLTTLKGSYFIWFDFSLLRTKKAFFWIQNVCFFSKKRVINRKHLLNPIWNTISKTTMIKIQWLEAFSLTYTTRIHKRIVNFLFLWLMHVFKYKKYILKKSRFLFVVPILKTQTLLDYMNDILKKSAFGLEKCFEWLSSKTFVIIQSHFYNY